MRLWPSTARKPAKKEKKTARKMKKELQIRGLIVLLWAGDMMFLVLLKGEC
jgi:hypothetical protein